jgi:hypothetical protein
MLWYCHIVTIDGFWVDDWIYWILMLVAMNNYYSLSYSKGHCNYSTHRVFSIFTSHCLLAASSRGCSPSSGFLYSPRPQLWTTSPHYIASAQTTQKMPPPLLGVLSTTFMWHECVQLWFVAWLEGRLLENLTRIHTAYSVLCSPYVQGSSYLCWLVHGNWCTSGCKACTNFADESVCLMANNVWFEGKLLILWTTWWHFVSWWTVRFMSGNLFMICQQWAAAVSSISCLF